MFDAQIIHLEQGAAFQCGDDLYMFTGDFDESGSGAYAVNLETGELKILPSFASVEPYDIEIIKKSVPRERIKYITKNKIRREE